MTATESFHEVPVQGEAPVQNHESYKPPHPTTPLDLDAVHTQLAQAAYGPAEMPTEPAPTRSRLLLRGSVLRRAGAAIAGTALAGAALATAIFGGDRAVAGTPSAAGTGGGNTGTEAPAAPGGADGSDSPEKESGVVNLCDKVELKDLLEWTGNSPAMFDLDNVDCTGTPPPEDGSSPAGVSLAAYGMWYPTSGGRSTFIDAMEVKIFEDETPNGSAFDHYLTTTFSEGSGAHVKTIDGRDAVVASAPATGRHKNDDGTLGDVTHGVITIAKFRQNDGSFRDLTIKTTVASGIGGQGEEIQQGVETAHEMALPNLGPVVAE